MEFERRVALLKDLEDIWAAGGTAMLQRVDSSQMESTRTKHVYGNLSHKLHFLVTYALYSGDAGSSQTPGCPSSSHRQTNQMGEHDDTDELQSSEAQEQGKLDNLSHICIRVPALTAA